MPSDWIAIFDEPERAAQALRDLRQLGVNHARIASPAAYPAVNLTGRPGPWRWMSRLVASGAVVGLATAIALEVGTSILHPMHVGGQPVIAWVPFGVIMFELTMLGAALANFSSMIFLCTVSRRGVAKAARNAVASDRLAVVIPLSGHSPEQREAIRGALAGAIAINESP